ncbi:hypothetical protein GLOIN_2v1779814 [Rhizophagus irregularis DAOM 181602=DAOM 197198]|uniref:Uncharacterized protein n=2 Tax=Rhizophagus irregularis TaxID=588596 RepID=U9T034_RHIID|nr:hypothetical protein GLOIN_2v1779814 [Rhizophagus irregularis DAOM 181602=DAOM 197198]POG67063.1 hypothetical protein GLOIN_2v1779814 [Rhizophagus irregularis DAOM 181602=DAOM 197198]GBC14593.2 hypothetical protein GLOIN_2v1779814 [Rhizophagus irregularis DAOM 181602=DAOM 197198]|eukprot:XP_025173929.1 hypothetical protein GLOIN_2v1779814 [Rhizophagus irregularis DAOM 181602=DAOM 197198]
MVVIPRIEYQLQAIVLSKEECEFLMQRINCLVKRCANLSRSTPNFIIYEKEIYGLKIIYDLQLESISKNIIYQANGNEKLRRLFKIKMMQGQKNLDCKMYRRNIYKGVNCWIRDAINLLKSGDMSICIHEIVDKDVNHKIKGGNVEVIDLMSKKEILKSAQSRRTKGVLFLEQVLESDKEHLMK